MDIKINEQYQSVIISLDGKLMGGPFGEEMNKTLHNLLDEGKKRVVVDLSKVGFVNSSGLGILISGLTTMRNGGGDLKLAGISSKIDGLLSITKLNQIFEQHPSVEEALKSF
ncbi:MAG: STAS domain-containing protein [Ignavibacteriaceae bacterium]|jgi:anti-sigma B factor antagonist|nr:STAS domain-containing protein [bacterium BMS3Abin03]